MILEIVQVSGWLRMVLLPAATFAEMMAEFQLVEI